jgi:hypothetical protein
MRWLLACLVLCGCAYDPQPAPTPVPDPLSKYDEMVMGVVVAYAEGCGASLVDTPAADSERAYNAALREARTKARIAAHLPEDSLLSGDADENRKIGEAWQRAAARIKRGGK